METELTEREQLVYDMIVKLEFSVDILIKYVYNKIGL